MLRNPLHGTECYPLSYAQKPNQMLSLSMFFHQVVGKTIRTRSSTLLQSGGIEMRHPNDGFTSTTGCVNETEVYEGNYAMPRP